MLTVLSDRPFAWACALCLERRDRLPLSKILSFFFLCRFVTLLLDVHLSFITLRDFDDALSLSLSRSMIYLARPTLEITRNKFSLSEYLSFLSTY